MNIVIFGLLAISLGLWGMSVWWWSVAELLRGLAPIVLVFLGVVALAAGVSKVRDEKGTKDEDILGDEG
ncbi:MAG: magnetosome protein MamI [Rhodospirillales bacterium]